MPALYIHIPFCLRKCPYCDFYSVPFDEALADKYTQTICGVLRSKRFDIGRVSTVYFGGGTPSLLSGRHIAAMLDAASQSCGIGDGAEITLELNPAASANFRELRGIGINRLSIGVQSAIGSELAALGRLHTAEEARAAILSAHDAGFDNISADLMLGIPGQTPDTLARSIGFLAEMPVCHISAYMLKIEEGTPFYDRGISPDDDLAADLYLQTVQSLQRRGFAQYEISNFAKPGMYSRHNMVYWQLGDYLGLGPAAHSFLAGERFSFGRDMAAFSDNPMSALKNEGPGGGCDEYIMLGLRLSEGLDLGELENRYNIDTALFLKKAGPFIQAKLAKLENGRLFLTPEGFLVSNGIIAGLTSAGLRF